MLKIFDNLKNIFSEISYYNRRDLEKCVITRYVILYGTKNCSLFSVKRAGGCLRPGEGQNLVLCFFLTERSARYQMLFIGSKMLFLAGVIEFQNLENRGNYSSRANFKRDFPKVDIFEILKSIFSNIFWAIILKISGYVPGNTQKRLAGLDFWVRP